MPLDGQKYLITIYRHGRLLRSIGPYETRSAADSARRSSLRAAHKENDAVGLDIKVQMLWPVDRETWRWV